MRRENPEVVKFTTLSGALRYLRYNGDYDDYADNGIPTPTAVKRYYDGNPDRAEIEKVWIDIFGDFRMRNV